MLRLFHSIFGAEKSPERYPEALVRAAIERAVDGTDPWLRGLSGYRRKLRPAVLHAIDHVVALVDSLEDALELSRQRYDDDPQLRLFFISAEQIDKLLASDPVLTAFHGEAGRAAQPAWALLTMECEQRQAFGFEQQGEMIVRDVAQITVSMSGHRLLDPTVDQNETRRLLKRRAFDHLLTLALARIAAIQDVREDLVQHRTTLQSKLNYLQRGDWGFGGLGRDVPAPVADLQQRINDIESQLSAVGGDDRYLELNLEILIDVLANAQQQLWAQPLPLIVDRMGIRRNQASADAPALALTELHNKAGRRLVARLVMLPA
jgi:hypothetical protein